MNSGCFLGSRLRLARLLAEESQASVAAGAGLDQSLVSRLEKGEREPTPIVAEALAEYLGVESHFFYAAPAVPVYDEEVHFRHRSRMSTSERNRALAHVAVICDVVRFLEQFVSLPEDRVPHVSATSNEEIEMAAEATRTALGLGLDRPLSNIIRAVENAGIVVIRASGYLTRTDAFSIGGGVARKVIFLNRLDGGSRTAFSVAHELAHLVMHEGRETGSRETESQADRFASAFLMPRLGFAREFRHHSPIRWKPLLALKTRWRASLQAIVRRAYDLGLITALEYQRYYKSISAAGWRHAEPAEPLAPEPEVLLSAFQLLAKDCRVTPGDAANTLGLRLATLVELVGADSLATEEPQQSGVTSLLLERARRRRG